MPTDLGVTVEDRPGGLADIGEGAVSAADLRRNRRLAYVALLAFAILLPTVDPVSLALEVTPLVALFELSVVLAAVLERRWTAASVGAEA